MVVMDATDVVATLSERHGYEEKELRECFAEAVLGGLLMSSYCKKGERINLKVKSQGPVLKRALIDATWDGGVRGFVSPADPQIFSEESNVIFLTRAEGFGLGRWGQGILEILRFKELEKDTPPYVSSVELATGLFPKDLAYYWATSEQVPTAVGMSVQFVNNDLQYCKAFLVQSMPGCPSSILGETEDHIKELEQRGSKFMDEDLETLSSLLLKDFPFQILEDRPLRFECHCSEERVSRALSLLNKNEIIQMIEEDHGAHIHCDYCGADYSFSEKDLENLVD